VGASTPSPRAPKATVAPDLAIADAARLTLATGVAAMKQHEAAAIAGDIEALHQMRVGTRRLRASVQLFAGVIHGSRMRIYKRDLPWLGQAAGSVRDCDVMEALLRDCSHHLEPALATALASIADAISTRRDAEHARFIDQLRTPRYRQMCARLADPLLRRALPATDAGCNAPEMIAPIARSVRKAGKRIARNAPPALFHRLRVRIKRLRYALEMLIEMGGKRSRKALMRLEQMQELLGVHQDTVTTTAWLRDYALGADGVAPETLMAVGATIQMLVDRRQQLATRAYRQWHKTLHSGVINDALEEISAAAERRMEVVREAQAEAERQARAAFEPAVEDASIEDASIDLNDPAATQVEQPNPSPTVADMTVEAAADATNPPAGAPASVAESSIAGPADAESEADAELPAVPHHGEN
jgi:CHAD domain-containing protein